MAAMYFYYPEFISTAQTNLRHFREWLFFGILNNIMLVFPFQVGNIETPYNDVASPLSSYNLNLHQEQDVPHHGCHVGVLLL